MSGLENWTVATPEIFLGVAAMVLLLIGVMRGERSANLTAILAVVVLIAGIVLLFCSPSGTAFGGMFNSNRFMALMKALILGGSAVAIVMSRSFFQREKVWRFEYPVLILLATVGMMMMVSANDLISLYVGIELQSLALYVIASFMRDSLRSTEAGVKYFVLGALSSGMLLYGASLIYGFAGSTNFASLAQIFADGRGSSGAVVGLVFLIAGLAFKVAAAPFHMWTPDVYEGAPTPVTMLFSVAPKVAAVSLFVTTMIGPFRPLLLQWQLVIVVVAVLSMVLGAFAAIGQNNIKRLMAYSSIGNVGYMLLALATGTEEGARGILVYLIIYVFMNIGIFAVILSMKRKGVMIENIPDLAGLSRRQPLMALALAAFMFSQAGIPPLAGFFGKLYIFIPVINAGLYIPAVIGVVASVVAAYYYLRIIKVAYFDPPTEPFDQPIERDMAVMMGLAGAFVAGFVIFTGPVLEAANAAAAILFKG
ncbi:MAG: NADH-quinone oxidoreductase subunit NuoN [Rhodospirillales bacterium]